MQYLYKIQPIRAAMLTDGPTPAEEAILEEHFENLLNRKDAKGAKDFPE